MADQEEYVVFEDAEGNEISNDPRWRAAKTLKSSGVDVNALQARIRELEAAQASGVVSPAAAASATESISQPPADPDDDEDFDLDDEGNRTYSEVSGKALKALASDRNVDITGLTKVGQVRDALRAADAEAKTQVGAE